MGTCEQLQLFEVGLANSNPALKPLLALLNAPDWSKIGGPFCPTAVNSVNKQAPSTSRILTMVAFAASCIGLLLFLWISFGGAIPFAPEGYRLNAEFNQAVQLAQESDVRISGVSVGKVVSVSLDRHTGLTKAVFQIDSQYAPAARRHPRDPPPEVAARGDVHRALARLAERAEARRRRHDPADADRPDRPA